MALCGGIAPCDLRVLAVVPASISWTLGLALTGGCSREGWKSSRELSVDMALPSSLGRWWPCSCPAEGWCWHGFPWAPRAAGRDGGGASYSGCR